MSRADGILLCPKCKRTHLCSTLSRGDLDDGGVKCPKCGYVKSRDKGDEKFILVN